MPETPKKKKLRIYKFTSEYNLATETIMEFLVEKGHKVKSHMSLLTDDMLVDIHDEFKKDIETAEKHYKKISEFQKLRSDNSEDSEEQSEEKVEEQKAEQEEETVTEEVASRGDGEPIEGYGDIPGSPAVKTKTTS